MAKLILQISVFIVLFLAFDVNGDETTRLRVQKGAGTALISIGLVTVLISAAIIPPLYRNDNFGRSTRNAAVGISIASLGTGIGVMFLGRTLVDRAKQKLK